MPNRILLLGAGFTRNWGGWLAAEAFEYLLGCNEINSSVRDLLLRYKEKGFEAALDALQAERQHETDGRLQNLELGLQTMFNAMNSAFPQVSFNFDKALEYTVSKFLTRFDAIFTLNQDCLLETHYLNDNIAILSNGRWQGWTIPGMKFLSGDESTSLADSTLTPTSQPPGIPDRLQPYIKLHGSSNWRSGGRLMVMGGNKSAAIRRESVLAWGMNAFNMFLEHPDTRLMVIGYSFRDSHINECLMKAARSSDLKLFIVDPQGMDVMNHSTQGGAIPADSDLAKTLWPYVRGCSRRPLSSTFGTDRAEHGNLMRFFG